MNNQTITSSDITWASQANMKMWEESRGTPLGRLKLAEAYLARIIVGDFSQRAERMDWLKSYIGPLIREVEPKAILGDSHLCGMVRQLWGERGIQKLRDKA
jgi:hypothetical protein